MRNTKGQVEMRGDVGEVGKGKGGGAQENPPRDTGEVSRGAFFPWCEIMWRLPYLEQVGESGGNLAKRGQFLLIPF